MKINPIDTTETNFKSKIIANNFLKEAMNLAEKNVVRSETKSLNYTKDYLDSINLIQSSKKAKEVLFDIDLNSGDTFVKEDGKKVLTYSFPQMCSLEYKAMQTINNYAKSLHLDPIPTILDKFKLELQLATEKYKLAQETYQVTINAILDDIVKNLK